MYLELLGSIIGTNILKCALINKAPAVTNTSLSFDKVEFWSFLGFSVLLL